MKIALIASDEDAHALAVGAAMERMGHDVPRLSGLPDAWFGEIPPPYDAHLPWLGAADVRAPVRERLQVALMLEASGSRPLMRASALERAHDYATMLASVRAHGLAVPPTWLLSPMRERWPEGQGPLHVLPRYSSAAVRPAHLVTTLAGAHDALGADIPGGAVLQVPLDVTRRLRLVCSSHRLLHAARIVDAGDGAMIDVLLTPPPEAIASLARQAVTALGGGVMAIDLVEDVTGRTYVADAHPACAFPVTDRTLAGEIAAAYIAALDRAGDRLMAPLRIPERAA